MSSVYQFIKKPHAITLKEKTEKYDIRVKLNKVS